MNYYTSPSFLINLIKFLTDSSIDYRNFTIEDLNTYKGWGHSSWKQCVDVAISSRVKQLCLFHF